MHTGLGLEAIKPLKSGFIDGWAAFQRNLACGTTLRSPGKWLM